MSTPTSQPTPLTPQERYEAALAALPAQRRKLVREYLRDLNGTRAAIRAGYAVASAASQASEILRSPKVAAAVDAGLDLQAMPAGEVLARLSAQARGDMGDFLRVDEEEVTLTWSLIAAPIGEDGEVDVGGLTVSLAMAGDVKPTDRVLQTATVRRSIARLDLLAAGQAGKLANVKKYSLDPESGKVLIELYSAREALELLGKHHGLFVERHEHTGADGGPIQYIEAVAPEGGEGCGE